MGNPKNLFYMDGNAWNTSFGLGGSKFDLTLRSPPSQLHVPRTGLEESRQGLGNVPPRIGEGGKMIGTVFLPINIERSTALSTNRTNYGSLISKKENS